MTKDERPSIKGDSVPATNTDGDSTTERSETLECVCGGSENKQFQSSSPPVVLCSVCVQNALNAAFARRAEARTRHAQLREECAKTLERCSQGQRLSELADESKQLRERLSHLRQQCASVAVQVAASVVENDERRLQVEEQQQQQQQQQKQSDMPVSQSLQRLNRLNAALYDPQHGAMVRAMHDSATRVRTLRFQWAIQAIRLFRLDVDTEEKRPSARQRHARGVGKIAGLPLPHAGPELYGVLPANELQSALRLVACLTLTVARCLGIVLPHPILLQPHGPTGDITDTVDEDTKGKNTSAKGLTKEGSNQNTNAPSAAPSRYDLASSTASLMSIVNTATSSVWGRTASMGKRATSIFPLSSGSSSKGTDQSRMLLRDTIQTAVPPSMHPNAVQRRLRHSSSAVLAEDGASSSSSSSSYALPSSAMTHSSVAATASRYALAVDSATIGSNKSSNESDEFAIGLQLLQNNVVALCIRAGVPITNIWPAEAVLLNLHALLVYAQEQVPEDLPPMLI